ncbi:conserved hypothetical protein [Heliomicrobium modesticaldum Ice1]|uniref:Methyltransferase n=1 Tax=Heliobacterium modesticaldum (strain ATCC 51547 / Ice1) TaxID=498761 RepID=B0TA43_HELMI|nr:methyltransferase domain-containing protein [Heliomicrobium modesticaldum]ABZ83580.1 conserved hypothetical protein [Heliomicrobium modesticaldum Ice1]
MQRVTELIAVPGGPVLTFTRIGNVDDLISAAQEEDDLPFWAELWPASLGLAAYLWRQVDMQERQVLELGCGLGLSGIVAALKGAEVTQTDFIPAALELAGENAARNGVKTERVWADWRRFPAMGNFSLIIGSDILYERTLHGNLETILTTHLAPGGEFIIADPGREWAALFFDRLDAAAWQRDLSIIPVHLDRKEYAIRIHRWQRRQHAVYDDC